MPPDERLSLAEINDLVHGALKGSGARGIQLEQATAAVVEAEADGLRTVGLGYLPSYCEHLKCNKIVGSARPCHEQVAGSAITSDAAQGFSFAAFHEAMDDFHALARAQGIAALAIRRSSSAGILGWFVERTAKAGLIGIGFANSSALMAPYGGTNAFFGTNPLAFAVPRGEGCPALIGDMATSQVAYVTVKEHAAEGKPIPLGWGLDEHGVPTTDPNEVLDGGAMAPAGGYKGSLLALLVDVLAGGLAGPNFSFQASLFGNNEGGPCDVGQMFIALAPETFTGIQSGPGPFAERLEIMLAALGEDDGVHLPGNSRHAHREQATAHGVTVPAELIARLRSYA
ncbi:MAG: Ldh family oxidoreductase [Anderseniella sp.]